MLKQIGIGKMTDREWQDGDDAALYDSGYDRGYYQGVFDACEYFRDELGIEDAMDTTLAQQAIEWLDNNPEEE